METAANKTKCLLIITAFLIFTSSCQNKFRLGTWEVQQTGGKGLSWTPFTWKTERYGDKVYEKAAMMIAVKVEGLPNTCLFQFDLGSNVTLLDELTLKSVLALHPQLNRLKENVFRDLTLSFGNLTTKTAYCYVMEGQGKKLSEKELKVTIQLGSIGADIFQNKVLIIDYPNQRFAVSDTVPEMTDVRYSKMDLSADGRILLPIEVNRKEYKVMFDNGSSIFPLIVPEKEIAHFSTAGNTDTVTVSAWGKQVQFPGRPVMQDIKLAGETYMNVTVYADPRGESRSEEFEGVVGNALFWDKTIIIDLKQKRFGIR